MLSSPGKPTRVTAELAGEHNHTTVQLAGEQTDVMVELAGELTRVMVQLSGEWLLCGISLVRSLPIFLSVNVLREIRESEIIIAVDFEITVFDPNS